MGCHEAWLSFAPSWRQSLLGFHLLGAWHHPTDATKCSARAATTEVWNWNWNGTFMLFYIIFSPNCHPKNQELELLLSCFPPKFKIAIVVIARGTTNRFTCSIFFSTWHASSSSTPKVCAFYHHFTMCLSCVYHVFSPSFHHVFTMLLPPDSPRSPPSNEEIHARGVLDEATAADALRHVANVMLNDLESRLLSDARCFKQNSCRWGLGWLGYPLVN